MSNKLTYSELTDYEKEAMSNGCGGKGSLINPPEFIFHETCNEHDFMYWLGKDKHDRKIADNIFLSNMIKDIKDVSWYKKPMYYAIAYSYYVDVRIAGGLFFNFSNRYKTIEDLYDEYY